VSFPFTEDELEREGLTGDNLSQPARQVLETMRKYPDDYQIPLFFVKIINNVAHRHHKSAHISPTFSDTSSVPSSDTSMLPSSVFTSTSVNDVDTSYTPTAYERVYYYFDINGDGHNPKLLYRSDYLIPFLKNPDSWSRGPYKSIRGVFNSLLNTI
jgi:hypothetical protein